MKQDDERTFCVTCEKSFHFLGTAAHRAAHRRREEDCTIIYTDGRTVFHGFSRMRSAEKVEP